MRYMIFDIEATSWEEQVSPEKTEILEIGAVELSSARTAVAVSSEFGMLVRPVGPPVLSDPQVSGLRCAI
jgi:inhibitor of KinA sporulation pathway (predicted exonuclease)